PARNSATSCDSRTLMDTLFIVSKPFAYICIHLSRFVTKPCAAVNSESRHPAGLANGQARPLRPDEPAGRTIAEGDRPKEPAGRTRRRRARTPRRSLGVDEELLSRSGAASWSCH